MTYPKALNLIVFLVFLSAATWSFSSPVLADNLGEKANSLADATQKAFQYSLDLLETNDDMPGIGIVIAYGSGNGVSAEYIGESFVNEFNRRGYQARYFIYDTEEEGMALYYRIGYTVLGPWDVDSAAGQVSKATDHANAARNVHRSVKGKSSIGF